MRRTEQLQGLRLMKFEDVYGRCYRGDLSQVEASEIDVTPPADGKQRKVYRPSVSRKPGDGRKG